jgi:DNA repair photolyase
LQNAVRSTEGEPSIPENYWYFSTHSNCFYGCRYCYLSGAKSIWFSPAVRVHVNLGEILEQVHGVAMGQRKQTSFYIGRLQDALNLDPLIGYSTALVPFFAQHRYARLIMLSKAAAIENLLRLDHKGRTTLCWSLIPPRIAERLETNVPDVESRIRAMKRCAEAGYPIRARIQPVFPRDEWRKEYEEFVENLVAELPLERVGFGGVYTNGRVNYIAQRQIPELYSAFKCRHKGNQDGDLYTREWCMKYYGDLAEAALRARPNIEIGACHLL